MKKFSGALRRSLGDGVKIDQNMLRYVLDQSRDCIKILGPKGDVSYVNSQGRCALEIADIDAVLGRPWPELWPEQSRPTVEQALADAQDGQGCEFDALRFDPGGEARWWRISVSPLLDGDGSLAGILTVSRDITDHVQLRESEQTLALELKHRLRNAYTIASAIVMQSARGDPEAQPFADLVCARLADVALSQTKLLEAGQRAWELAELIRTLVAAHGEGASRIRFAGPADSKADGHEAMLIALVIGELTNNSLKYGALGKLKSVSLSWTDDGASLSLSWREPLSSADDQSLRARDASSGYSMMERMARSQKALFEHSVKNGELQVHLQIRRRVPSTAVRS